MSEMYVGARPQRLVHEQNCFKVYSLSDRKPGRDLSTGLIWSYFLVLGRTRAAAFWMYCSCLTARLKPSEQAVTVVLPDGDKHMDKSF